MRPPYKLSWLLFTISVVVMLFNDYSLVDYLQNFHAYFSNKEYEPTKLLLSAMSLYLLSSSLLLTFYSSKTKRRNAEPKVKKYKKGGEVSLKTPQKLNAGDAQSDKLAQELKSLMEEEKLFKDADLKASKLAQKLRISESKLREIVKVLGFKNINSLINHYRIEEACMLIRSAEDKLTSQEIGYDVGFNNPQNFIRVFQKIKGCSPSDFIKSQ